MSPAEEDGGEEESFGVGPFKSGAFLVGTVPLNSRHGGCREMS